MKSPTIWGIDVIFTSRAAKAPMAEPIPAPAMIQAHLICVIALSAVATAISIPMADIALTMARSFAQMSKAFVLSAAGVVDDRMRSMLSDRTEDLDFLRRPEVAGGSVIVAPDMRILAGPLEGDVEGIIYADLDFEISVKMKLRHDLAGHYNRPDVFRLLVNRNPAELMEVFDDGFDPLKIDAGAEVETGGRPQLPSPE